MVINHSMGIEIVSPLYGYFQLVVGVPQNRWFRKEHALFLGTPRIPIHGKDKSHADPNFTSMWTSPYVHRT